MGHGLSFYPNAVINDTLDNIKSLQYGVLKS